MLILALHWERNVLNLAIASRTRTSKYNTVIWRTCTARTDRLSSATRTVVIQIRNEFQVNSHPEFTQTSLWKWIHRSVILFLHFVKKYSGILLQYYSTQVFLQWRTQIWDAIRFNCITYVKCSESDKPSCKYYYD